MCSVKRSVFVASGLAPFFAVAAIFALIHRTQNWQLAFRALCVVVAAVAVARTLWVIAELVAAAARVIAESVARFFTAMLEAVVQAVTAVLEVVFQSVAALLSFTVLLGAGAAGSRRRRGRGGHEYFVGPRGGLYRHTAGGRRVYDY